MTKHRALSYIVALSLIGIVIGVYIIKQLSASADTVDMSIMRDVTLEGTLMGTSDSVRLSNGNPSDVYVLVTSDSSYKIIPTSEILSQVAQRDADASTVVRVTGNTSRIRNSGVVQATDISIVK